MLTSTEQSTPTGRLHLAAVAFALSACMGSAPRSRAFSPPPYGACRPIHSDRTSSGGVVVPAAPTSWSGRLRAGDASPPPSCDAIDDAPPPPPADMRLSDIQTELRGMNVSYADCFDRDSLEKRLAEARDGSGSDSTAGAAASAGGSRSSRGVETAGSSSAYPDTDVDATETSKSAVASREFDRGSTLAEIRNLRVRELKVKLSEMKVRWGTMIEKEEMVQALCDAMEERFVRGENFSRTGILVPGVVKDVDEDALMRELGWSESDVSRGVASRGVDDDVASPPAPRRPPLLLDVYATWCGPCQFMAPLLAKAAEELGPDVRVVKLDSDKYPRISSVLKGKLPLLLRCAFLRLRSFFLLNPTVL